MSYCAVIEQLRSKFQVLCLIDLSDHTDVKVETLYGALEPFKDPVFSSDERLVVIVDKSLPQMFDDEPPEALTKLQNLLRYLNVPHEHIVVVTNNPQVPEYLIYLKDKYYPQELMPMSCVTI